MRITTKMLYYGLSRLNSALGTTKGKDDFTLQFAYGGFQLQRTRGMGSDTITMGFRPKKEVYDAMMFMVLGVKLCQDKEEEKKFAATQQEMLFNET